MQVILAGIVKFVDRLCTQVQFQKILLGLAQVQWTKLGGLLGPVKYIASSPATGSEFPWCYSVLGFETSTLSTWKHWVLVIRQMLGFTYNKAELRKVPTSRSEEHRRLLVPSIPILIDKLDFKV